MNKKPAAPDHLSPESKAWYLEITRDFELENHHRRLLQACCESWDRAQEARIQIATEGLTHRDRHGNLRPHPGVQIERDNRTLFARLLREVGLDVESPGDRRPPTITGNAGKKGR